MPDPDQTKTLLGLTVQIVAAHVKNNSIAAPQLPSLIQQVYAALSRAGTPAVERVEPEKPARPAAPKRTIYPDYIICLEDGRRMKTLKRHLRSKYDLSPEQYREKWDLPADYPMVAPSYAARRSSLAKQLGLGRKPAGAGAAEEAEQRLPLEQPPRRTWQIVSAPESVTAAPAPEPHRAEPTLDSVFHNFPNNQPEQEETTGPAAATATSGQPRAARKPFSKQLARTMRP